MLVKSLLNLTLSAGLLGLTACDKGAEELPDTSAPSAQDSDSPDSDPGSADADGDGVDAQTDCDDSDPAIGAAQTWYIDTDGDGFGDDSVDSVEACEAPSEDFVLQAGDCDDSASEVYPGAPEFCDGRDEDCDEVADNDAEDALTYCPDQDSDGYGSEEGCVESCEAPEDELTWVEDGSDCDDLNNSIYPDAEEICNGEDEDCDERTDEDVVQFFHWMDEDGDGYGDPDRPLCSEDLEDAVENEEDCDDSDPDISPEGTEVCDGLDNDCDGSPDLNVCSCPVESYDGVPYQFCESNLPWEQALAACEADGYTLVTVEDAKQNSWLADTAALYSRRDTFWIGFNDLEVDGSWVWASGSTSTYTSWNSGEPNGTESENCAELYINIHGWHSRWNDANCDGSKRYICEPAR